MKEEKVHFKIEIQMFLFAQVRLEICRNKAHKREQALLTCRIASPMNSKPESSAMRIEEKKTT